MPRKYRGIFLVYVDIDAKDAQESNEWFNKGCGKPVMARTAAGLP